MKYYIEFELPDNDVVLELIEHEWVKWGVWGYSGYAYAKPVAYEKPDLSTMLFSERKELAEKYEQWAKKNCVKDCALSVISYLCAFGYIPTLFNRERKHGKCIEELPSAEPERHGRWIVDEAKSANHIEKIYICSSCKNFEAWGETELYNYCPNCGADMRGEQNG